MGWESALATRKNSIQKLRIRNLAEKRQGSVIRSGLIQHKAQSNLGTGDGGVRGRGEVY